MENGKAVQNPINHLAELKDAAEEKKFHDDEVRTGLQLSRNIVLVFAFVNFLFVFMDYEYLNYSNKSAIFYNSLIPRAVTLVTAILVCILLQKSKNKSMAMNSIAAFAILAYLLHEYTAMHFAPVDSTFEVFDLVISTYGLFTIPNRWVTSVLSSLSLSIAFFVLTPFTIPNMRFGTKIILAVYLLFQLLMLALLFFKSNIQKRMNYLQRQQLELLAKTDILTKAFNRAACDTSICQMCTSHQKFSLIMVDIDNFKQINDTYGHLTGDEVIVKTAEVISASVGPDDIVARWGGDEFIIVLPYTSLDRGAKIAGQIKEHLLAITYCNASKKATASFGVTEFTEGDDLSSIMRRVDQLLYRAKQKGKNEIAFG